MNTDLQIYSGFWRRVAAAVIDMIILWPLSWVFVHAQLLPLSQITGAIVVCALVVIYDIAFVTSGWQATPGKRLMNIYIATFDNHKISPARALGRLGTKAIPASFILIVSISVHIAGFEQFEAVNAQAPDLVKVTILWLSIAMIVVTFLWALLWYIPAAFTREHKAVHDMICKTRVRRGRI